MRIYYLIIVFFFNFSITTAEEFKLIKITDDLKSPWSLSFINQNEALITEKPGNIIYINIQKQKLKNIKHNLKVLEHGQGGLLDILYYDESVFVSYTEKIKDFESSTSIAKGRFNKNKINFKNIFQAEPPIESRYHFGSRLAIKENYLFASVGERGQGMIAQDGTKHPGSIIRIHLDGGIPKNNPKFKGKEDWLPEIFQIGIRNPQGMALSPFDNKIYLSNHGAKGGDWFGAVKYGENYGWIILGWGGKNYSGTKIGPKWKPGFTKAIKYWVPSIAVSAITIYKGEEFKEWNGDALITSLKDESLRKIKFKGNEFINEDIIFKGNIGRIRDIKIQPDTGKLFFLSDDGSLWQMKK